MASPPTSAIATLLVIALAAAFILLSDGLGLNYVAFLGWVSALFAFASYEQYYSMPTRALRQLQVPSMFCHPFFAVPALLTGHGIASTPSWALVGCCLVDFLYVRSLMPGVGLPWPGSLVDWFRSALYFLGVIALLPMVFP